MPTPECAAQVAEMIASLEYDPASGGMPASARLPIHMRIQVAGISFANPPILRMSCSSDIAWITEPAQRKSSALKKACVIRWNTEA